MRVAGAAGEGEANSYCALICEPIRLASVVVNSPRFFDPAEFE